MPGLHQIVGQPVELLVLAVAKDEAVVGVPQHEGLRDRLDGVAQAQVASARRFGQPTLLGDVDGDADEMRLVFGVGHDLGAGADPDPVAFGVAHAELAVEAALARADQVIGELARDRRRSGLVSAATSLIESSRFCGSKPEDLEHRGRPEDRAARQIPLPEAGAATPERRVDARLGGRIDVVGLVCAGGLRVIGEAEDHEHDARRHEDGRLARDGAPPIRRMPPTVGCSTAIEPTPSRL